MNRLCFLALIAASGAVFADDANQELVKAEGRSPWHFRIGPVMAPNVRVNVRCSSPKTLPSILPSSGSATTAGATVADPAAGFVDRFYVDGYVKPDEGTEDPNSMISGLTWDWGANNVAGQYSNGRMEFHSDVTRWTESVSSSSYGSSRGSVSESDRDTLLGVEAMGGWTFFENDSFDAAVDAGFRYYGSGDLSAQSRYGTSVMTTRSAYRFVDSYDASGWTSVPSGAHAGEPGGPGRLLGAIPTRREELAGSSSTTKSYFRNASTDLDYHIWDLRLGPTLGWKALDCLTIRGGRLRDARPGRCRIEDDG